MHLRACIHLRDERIIGGNKMIGAIIVKRKVRLALDAFNRRDFPTMLRDWSEDVTFIFPGNLSVSGRVEGKKAMEQWLQKFSQRVPKWNITVKNIFIRNPFAFGRTNIAAAELEFDLTNREGRSFHQYTVTVIHIKGGKAVLVRDYLDTELARKVWGEDKV